jgi:hypothetical protein
MLGRLFAGTAPANGPVPDITSRGVVAAGVFTPDAAPGELVANYASFTYGRAGDDRPDFADLRVIVREVTQVRRAATPAAAFQRRTGTPTVRTETCVDRAMAVQFFLLDARWRAVAECLDTLSWSGWMPGRNEALMPPVPQAPGYRWVTRPAGPPEYREFTGRLFGEGAAANGDPRYNDLTGPAAIAIGMFTPRARLGETFASYGTQFFNLESNLLPDINNLRIIVKDLTEVRVSFAGTSGISLDVRKGTMTVRYQQCLRQRGPELMYLVDGRWRAMAECQDLVTWGPWSAGRRLPVSGTFAADGITTFDYAWDAAAGELRITLQ